MKLSKEQLIKDIKDIGVEEGAILHVKVSLKSLSKMEEGVFTLIDALVESVGSSGTIVADAFIESYPLPLSNKNRDKISRYDTPSYAGVFVNAMIDYPGAVRSRHPIQKFVALGRHAQTLMHNHMPGSYGYQVMEQIAHMGAYNLNIGTKVEGVGTTHVAVEKVGLKKRNPLKGVRYLTIRGTYDIAKVDWHGGCSKGFPKFIPYYKERGIVRYGKIGGADSMLTSMRETLKCEIEVLKDNPSIFFCDNPECKDCRLRWNHSRGNIISVKYHSALILLKRFFNRIIR
ncbi:AAC(3) family N-acetyltransferase [Marinilabiliaceae bacterium ANBcel2]|nr:AAC(3) family N-acetyltransferase [Marinilabiliaceae bacterium ANBcel2]